MFHSLSLIQSIDLSSFDARNVTNMGRMFSGCSSLKNINFSSFNTSKVTNMQYMFHLCISLETLDVSSFDTSQVVNFESMFRSCSKLKFLNLSNFNTRSEQNMSFMFQNSMNLNLVILSPNFIMKSDSSENFLSNECMEIVENGADILVEIKNELKKCPNVIEIEIDSKNVEKIKFINYFSAINNNNIYKEIEINKILIYINSELKQKTKFINAKNDETYMIKLKYPSDFNSNCDGMFKDLDKIKSIKFYNFKGCKTASQMFLNTSLETLNLSQFNTSQISNMYQMFANSKLLKSIGVSKFELKNNVYLEDMFCNCLSLKNIDKLSFTKIAFLCQENFPYFIEKLEIYIEKCENSNYQYSIEETKRCVESCDKEKFPVIIFHNKTCSKFCSKDLYLYNSICYINCPEKTHKNELKNICECNNLYYID